jgi:hypothetical protein
MMEGTDFLEYLEIQDSLDMVTKSELLDEVRRQGGRISGRQLTTYTTERLIPRSVRVGSRAGAYPKLVVELVLWVSVARSSGLSVEAIRELIPLWKYMVRARREGRVDLMEFEYLARQHVVSLEAGFAVPWLFRWALPCPIHEPDEIASFKFFDKNGHPVSHSLRSPLSVGFVIAEQDEESGDVVRHASMRMTLPLREDGTEPTSVILGIPNGVELPKPLRRRRRKVRGPVNQSQAGPPTSREEAKK